MPRMSNKKNQRLQMNICRQFGVGLVEVLVAVVIASFSLLGFAGLQMASLRYQKVAQFRSLASQYSADIADRVRANVAGAKNGNYATTDTYPANVAPTVTNCITDCTPAQVASQDIYNWRVALGAAIGSGWGSITGDVTNGFTVTVYFKEPNKPKGAADAADPNCADGTDKDVRCFKTVFLP